MKKIFFLFLFANLFFAAMQFFLLTLHEREITTVSNAINQEEIILLPAIVPCIEWGNFSESDIESAETALQALDLNLPHRQALSAPLIQYRLHTTPFKDQQAAEREINKFRNMGIISYRITEQGLWFNAISFGEFADKQTAQILQKKLDAQEITDTIINQHVIRQKKILFLEVSTRSISDTTSELQPLILQFPSSKLTQTTCERL